MFAARSTYRSAHSKKCTDILFGGYDAIAAEVKETVRAQTIDGSGRQDTKYFVVLR